MSEARDIFMNSFNWAQEVTDYEDQIRISNVKSRQMGSDRIQAYLMTLSALEGKIHAELGVKEKEPDYGIEF